MNDQQDDTDRRKVHVIINPASGKGSPILKILNDVFGEANVDWDAFITKRPGDAKRFAQEAVAAGVDVVAVHGGDGTVMEVASGLIGSDVPMGILPGGTANVISVELGISSDLAEACALAANRQAPLREIDMGKINGDSYFLLRASAGLEALMVEGADRELKDRFGNFAYTLAGIQALADPPVTTYRVTLDGKPVETQGLTCIIANSGNIGVPGVRLAPDIEVDDGLLDVLVLRHGDISALASVILSVVSGAERPEDIAHWQAREITVEAAEEQDVQVDGEVICKTPIEASVLPKAVRVIVPEQE